MTERFHFTRPGLNALPPARKGRRDYYNDDRVQGLQLVVTDRGSKAYYLYSWFRGRPKRFRIAGLQDMTPEMARKAATKMRGELAQNQDPTAERQRQRQRGVTLRAAFDAFRQARRKLKEKTLEEYRRILEVLFVDWIDRPFIDITKDKVLQRHTEITERNGAAQADNAMRTLRSILNFAMVHYEGADGAPPMPQNPVQRLSQTKSWNRVGRRRTLIKAHQLKSWFAAVLKLKLMPPNSQDALVADYLVFLVLTGLRRTEAAELTWDRVDFSARTFTLTDADTKNREQHTLPLSDYLLDLLRKRRELTQGRYVFPGSGATGRLADPRIQVGRVTEDSGVEFTLHDLRRTFATIAESLDIPAYALKSLLNHKTKHDVTAGYVVIDAERLREPMQRITDYALRSAGLRDTATVVRLKTERRR